MSSQDRNHHAKRWLDDLIGRFAQPLTQARQPFWKLVHALRAHSRLLKSVQVSGRAAPFSAEQILTACVRLASNWESWKRTPEAWAPLEGSPFVQFRSLVSHLFDEYPVPHFMPPIWWSETEASWELELYLHLAAGFSIRKVQLPVSYRLSKRAGALFMQAPDDLTPTGALRWAQVGSLGGDSRLARFISTGTLLSALTEHEEFWESVIRFLIKHSPINAEEIVSIVQFIHQQRFLPARTVWGGGAGDQPLQPEFSLRNRSLMGLRRHMAHWRSELASTLPLFTPPVPEWERTNIGAFRLAQHDAIWTIEELLTDRELRVEGGIMQHCVASYISACSRRQTSIWSMKIQQGERSRRVLTIEVVPSTKTIWQAKGKRNAPPTSDAKMILQRWAEQEGLTLRGSVTNHC